MGSRSGGDSRGVGPHSRGGLSPTWRLVCSRIQARKVAASKSADECAARLDLHGPKLSRPCWVRVFAITTPVTRYGFCPESLTPPGHAAERWRCRYPRVVTAPDLTEFGPESSILGYKLGRRADQVLRSVEGVA